MSPLMQASLIFSALLLLTPPAAIAFVPIKQSSWTTNTARQGMSMTQSSRLSSSLFFAEKDAAQSSSSTRRRKRKAPRDETESSSPSATESASIARPKDVPVELTIQNLKRTATKDTDESAAGRSSMTSSFSNPFQKSAQQTETRPASLPSLSSSDKTNESLKQLLIDAQQMQSSQSSSDSSTTSSNNNPIKNILSTIVTIDFFVVCGFLVWFLAGIFCSTVLKDDGVQIAFNSNFQAFVQPALGVLMIASVASSVVGGDDEQEQ